MLFQSFKIASLYIESEFYISDFSDLVHLVDSSESPPSDVVNHHRSLRNLY